jgi:2,3-dimethylmalate lyase
MQTFRQLVASERPLVLPGAHDAISARLIKRAGFKAFFIGGFPLVGARFGVPDIGLLALGEIGPGIRDIVSACDLPVLVDCDNGYGDVKTVVHVINFYERLGAQAVFFEDQVSSSRERTHARSMGWTKRSDAASDTLAQALMHSSSRRQPVSKS